MKRLIIMVALVAALFTVAIANGSAAAPTGNKAFCFDGTVETAGFYGGSCTVLSPNRFFLDTNGGNVNGEYAGVAIENNYPVGTSLASIDKLSFNYSGTTPWGGAPRFSIGIDNDGDGSGYDAFAFVDAAGCSDGLGKVDVVNDATCTVWYGAGSYANWAAFVAAYPTAEIGYAYTFVIADAPGEWTIWNVKAGAQSRGGK